MKFQAILPLITYPDANSDAVAENAVAAAKHLGAHLHVIHLRTDLPVSANALSRVVLGMPEIVREVEDRCNQRGDELLALIRGKAQDLRVTVSTDALTKRGPDGAETAAAFGRYYDYVLCGWEPGNPTSWRLAEALVFGAGRPTILLPEHHTIQPFAHVAIAWDGSRVAARAVGDAGELLRAADKVTVMTVAGEKVLPHADAAERLAEGLAARGIRAQSSVITKSPLGVGTALQEHALEIAADLMVVGGFGHSRLRDFVLGGATQAILSELRLPTLISH
jgi:nucleotide-binding universal stress UspA family protein